MRVRLTSGHTDPNQVGVELEALRKMPPDVVLRLRQSWVASRDWAATSTKPGGRRTCIMKGDDRLARIARGESVICNRKCIGMQHARTSINFLNAHIGLGNGCALYVASS